MTYERWYVPPELKQKMHVLGSELRKCHTASEEILWKALRNRKLAGRKFRRQHPIGAFVVDFLCAEEMLVVEVDGKIHESQREADIRRQEIIESLGFRFVRVTAEMVEDNLPEVLRIIQAAFDK